MITSIGLKKLGVIIPTVFQRLVIVYQFLTNAGSFVNFCVETHLTFVPSLAPLTQHHRRCLTTEIQIIYVVESLRINRINIIIKFITIQLHYGHSDECMYIVYWMYKVSRLNLSLADPWIEKVERPKYCVMFFAFGLQPFVCWHILDCVFLVLCINVRRQI